MTPLATALSAYVTQHGLEHDDPECPEDDTCACPVFLAVSRALDADRLGSEIDALEEALARKRSAFRALTKGSDGAKLREPLRFRIKTLLGSEPSSTFTARTVQKRLGGADAFDTVTTQLCKMVVARLIVRTGRGLYCSQSHAREGTQ